MKTNPIHGVPPKIANRNLSIYRAEFTPDLQGNVDLSEIAPDQDSLVEKYHDRIASLHLKDRKGPGSPDSGGRGGGPNMPWGQGETPHKEVLQLMKRNKYAFPASIEYQTPEGSDVLAEIKKCVKYCQDALA